ncbi:hypothetical protein [Limnoglobus roseus]|uniref:Uncharacterized protein n=1 Tax=Limnoglobus roseus TaxID=2598579 RepID=A0A5C1ALJ9_9BACT|nr:hypothetical protein [Limnoglobus roseus]QEL19023.1 hypothetical protein PX52LOC_06077 [Limnoglobus roseus]
MTADRKLRLAGFALILVGTIAAIINGRVNITKNNRMIALSENRPTSELPSSEYHTRLQEDLSERWRAAENASAWQTQLVIISYITMLLIGMLVLNAARSLPTVSSPSALREGSPIA